MGDSVKLRFLTLMAACLSALIAGCAGQPAPPTAPPPTIIITATPATEAPTPTPLSRATLPPTWTPAGTETNTPEPTPTIDIRETLVNITPTPPACFTFGEDTERSSTLFTPGDSVSVFWVVMPDAVEYEVRLYDQDNNLLAAGVTSADEFRFDGVLFEFERSYYWTVRPFDDEGNQLCPITGGLLLPAP